MFLVLVETREEIRSSKTTDATGVQQETTDKTTKGFDFRLNTSFIYLWKFSNRRTK